MEKEVALIKNQDVQFSKKKNGFLLRRYSALFTVESVSLLYLLVMS